MWSSLAVSVGAACLFGLGTAHGFDWVDGLPNCWQQCLSGTSDGCDSQKCICDASQSDSYLTSGVECAVSKCDADSWGLSLGFLGPLEVFCGASGQEIPESVMNSAYACATATATAAPSTTTRKVEHSTGSDQKSTKGSNGLKSTVTSTLTQTSTDGDGNTLQVIVPIVMGPSTMSTGKAVTSTVESKSSAPSAPSSAAASPSQTPAPSSPTPTQAQGALSSTATAQSTQRTSNSNGSPFENMQAGATQWRFSGLLVGLGVLAGVFMRL